MEATPYRRILVPTDFSEHSQLAIEHAVQLAKLSHGKLQLLAVVEPVPFIGGDVTVAVPGWNPISLEEYGRKEAEKELERLTSELSARGVEIEAKVEFGGPAATICRAAEGFDLIVMGTHGRSGIARAFLGSVTQQVVARAPCPVLTVRHHQTVPHR